MTRMRWLTVAAVATAVLGLVLFLLWVAVSRTDTGVVLLSDNPTLLPSGRLAENLRGSDADLIRESLSVLAERGDPVAADDAVTLLRHEDPYVWFNAALYLGKLGRAEAVPYLIKGLRHPAWRAHAEAATDLAAITGQNFGTAYPKWHDWWMQTNPGSDFNFDERLGK